MNPQRISVVPFPVPNSAPGSSTEDKTSNELTIEGLVQRVGVASRAQVHAFVGRAPTTAPVDNGGRVSGDRIRKDGVRIFGAALDFLAVATPDQRRLLLGVTDGFLAAGVAALQECDALGGATKRMKTAKTRLRAQDRTRVESAASEATTQRDILYAACLPLTGGAVTWKERLDDARKRQDRTNKSLADALEGTGKVARELAAEATARGLPHALDEACFESVLALAKRLKNADHGAPGGAAQVNVEQGNVAWWRGACLWFIKALLDMFAAARRGDKRIPQLRAKTLKTVFYRGGKHAPKNTSKNAPKPTDAKPVTPPNG